MVAGYGPPHTACSSGGASLIFDVGQGQTLLNQPADELPQTSPEGLELQKDTKARVVYLKPGATLGQYQRVAILDCFVDFAKDWQKQFNRDQRTTGSRVTTKDMERCTGRPGAAPGHHQSGHHRAGPAVARHEPDDCPVGGPDDAVPGTLHARYGHW